MVENYVCPHKKVNSNTIELVMHTCCYCVSDLLCVNMSKMLKNLYFEDLQSVLPTDLN